MEDLRWRTVRAKVVLSCICTAIAGALVGNGRVLPFLLGACLLYGGAMAWFATQRVRAVLASQRDPGSGELPFVRLRLKPADVLFIKAWRRG
jgi:hypothetical protein